MSCAGTSATSAPCFRCSSWASTSTRSTPSSFPTIRVRHARDALRETHAKAPLKIVTPCPLLSVRTSTYQAHSVAWRGRGLRRGTPPLDTGVAALGRGCGVFYFVARGALSKGHRATTSLPRAMYDCLCSEHRFRTGGEKGAERRRRRIIMRKHEPRSRLVVSRLLMMKDCTAAVVHN